MGNKEKDQAEKVRTPDIGLGGWIKNYTVMSGLCAGIKKVSPGNPLDNRAKMTPVDRRFRESLSRSMWSTRDVPNFHTPSYFYHVADRSRNRAVK